MKPTIPNHGFTLVELLVVIVIIGILAAVAIPQFGQSSRDAKIAALDQDLACVRSVIELYHHQHNGIYPGTSAKHRPDVSTSPSAHTSPIDAFTKQLALYSNADGDTCGEKSTDYPYGPYLRMGIPKNPLPAATADGGEAAVSVTTDTTPLTPDTSPTTGWKASSETGEFIANNPDYASR